MKPNKNSTAEWLEKYERVPVWRKVKWREQDPWQLYLALTKESGYAFIVESGRSGRYTYVGAEPVRTIQIKNGEIKENGGMAYQTLADPLAVVRRWMMHESSPSSRQVQEAGLPDWTGGAAGYLSYDTARYFEFFPRTAEDDLQLPDVYLMMMEEVYAFDHETKDIFLVVHAGQKARIQKEEDAEQRLVQMESFLKETHVSNGTLPSLFGDIVDTGTASVSFAQHEFEQAVQKVQEYIAAGDVFQVNLSVRQTKEAASSAEEVYEVLRILNPSPYMGLLRFPEFQLVSASPELLLQVKGNQLSTRPIAGTRRRGKTEEEDAELVRELLDNEKEVAEHIMLVDLERNDLGRVSRYGSVHVDELMVVEKYSHVMHIVSNVIGELADGKDMYDAIIAAFPGGTITGAPKVRTMEIIEELEPVTRGPYTGSMCLLGFTGDAVCNIIIRTMIVKDGQVHVQAGAGIVIDSIPKAEYYESLKKAEAVWKALSLSEAKKRRVRERRAET
ncbi:anthranilate synthase component I family protein [Aneurinibacillus tyrosinisolvens]|uniref:anthranilate synthase component I family protein n=1 Tax=Aneurinibacillus tyrosinisolvens TaxID=1443435 RepID=UPI0006994000|nr:anthranilate synthase component I family protein [Aneurinibacillus tyrosinisolvens]